MRQNDRILTLHNISGHETLPPGHLTGGWLEEGDLARLSRSSRLYWTLLQLLLLGPRCSFAASTALASFSSSGEAEERNILTPSTTTHSRSLMLVLGNKSFTEVWNLKSSPSLFPAGWTLLMVAADGGVTELEVALAGVCCVLLLCCLSSTWGILSL